VLLIPVVLLAILFCIGYMYYGRLWLRCHVANASVPLASIIGLTFKKVRADTVMLAYIDANKAGLKVELDELVEHYLAGGNVMQVVRACISAKKDGRDVSIAEARSVDLQGKDVLKELGTPIASIRTGNRDE
jgi:uncharacterized protein YqfA (UPF0365 family)